MSKRRVVGAQHDPGQVVGRVGDARLAPVDQAADPRVERSARSTAVDQHVLGREVAVDRRRDELPEADVLERALPAGQQQRPAGRPARAALSSSAIRRWRYSSAEYDGTPGLVEDLRAGSRAGRR